MKENRYDDQEFFDRYAEMARSRKGLSGAGEWPVLKEMLPDLQGCRMLDLGCGYGWHCRYAVDQGASAVVGIDISERMLQKAKQLGDDPRITYHAAHARDVGGTEGIDTEYKDFRHRFSFLLERRRVWARPECAGLRTGGRPPGRPPVEMGGYYFARASRQAVSKAA